MRFSAVAEQGFPAIGDRFRTAHHAIVRSCLPAVRHRHAPVQMSHASTRTPHASMPFALSSARTHRCVDPIVSTSRIGCAARDLRYLHALLAIAIAATSRGAHRRCSTCKSAASIDTFNTPIRTRRSHRLRAYRQVACEKFARVVASTHRFFSTRIAPRARRRARRCRTCAPHVHPFTMHTRTTSRVAVNRHDYWVCGTRVSTWSNAVT